MQPCYYQMFGLVTADQMNFELTLKQLIFIKQLTIQ